MGLDELATFVEVIERGTLAGAARALGLPKSTVSRRLTRLEDELGQPLLVRHSRLLRVTEAGEALYQRSVAAVRDLQEASRHVRQGAGALRGLLRITVPQDLGTSIAFAEMFAGFQRMYPEVELFVDVTDRAVDLLAEGYDFAFRGHPRPLPSTSALMIQRVGALAIGLYASPAYLDEHGRPGDPDDLGNHRFAVPATMRPEHARLTHAATGRTVELSLPAALRTTSIGFLPAAAAGGVGIAVVLARNAEPLVAAGKLERVLPDWALPGGTLSLLWPATRIASPRRRAFLDYIRANFAS
jgi:DNA-binding transcriptional LysR family regulator